MLFLLCNGRGRYRMIRYAALASDGGKTRSDDRETIDRWACDKCAAGFDVEVYARGRYRGTGIQEGDGDTVVGRWMA